MYCKNCGTNTENSRFCPNCGKAVNDTDNRQPNKVIIFIFSAVGAVLGVLIAISTL